MAALGLGVGSRKQGGGEEKKRIGCSEDRTTNVFSERAGRRQRFHNVEVSVRQNESVRADGEGLAGGLQNARSRPLATLEELFFDSVLRIEKCGYLLADLPASPPPCESRQALDTRPTARPQPEACRTVRPRDTTVASARDLRLGSHKMCRIISCSPNRRSCCGESLIFDRGPAVIWQPPSQR